MNRALEYAEKRLGVHQVHAEAQALLEELNESLNALDSAIDTRRALDERISNYEMDLLIEERGKHPDHSEAAFQRHLKEVTHKDETLKRLRSQRNAKAGEASGLELDIEYTKYRLKVKVARMEELAGYFQFLAAVKNAETSTLAYTMATGEETNETNKTGETK